MATAVKLTKEVVVFPEQFVLSSLKPMQLVNDPQVPEYTLRKVSFEEVLQVEIVTVPE